MGKYDPLGEYLSGQAARAVTLSFAEIEGILGADLPNSARKHRPWWGNDRRHPHARCWMDAGWEVSSCSLAEERVTFIRRQTGVPEILPEEQGGSTNSTQHDFSDLYAQYPSVLEAMDSVFTSHEFILALAQANQRLYIEALHSYRESPAPFRAVHARLSRHLRSLTTIQHLGNVKSNNIFGKPSRCARWQKTG